MIKPYDFNNVLYLESVSEYLTGRVDFMLRCVLNGYRIRLEEISDEDIDRLILAEVSSREAFGGVLFVPEKYKDPEHAKAFLCAALSDLEAVLKTKEQVFLSVPAQFFVSRIIQIYAKSHDTYEPVSGRVLAAAEGEAEAAYRKYGGSYKQRLSEAKKTYGDAKSWVCGAFSPVCSEKTLLLKNRGSNVRRLCGCDEPQDTDGFETVMTGRRRKEAV